MLDIHAIGNAVAVGIGHIHKYRDLHDVDLILGAKMRIKRNIREILPRHVTAHGEIGVLHHLGLDDIRVILDHDLGGGGKHAGKIGMLRHGLQHPRLAVHRAGDGCGKLMGNGSLAVDAKLGKYAVLAGVKATAVVFPRAAFPVIFFPTGDPALAEAGGGPRLHGKIQIFGVTVKHRNRVKIGGGHHRGDLLSCRKRR